MVLVVLAAIASAMRDWRRGHGAALVAPRRAARKTFTAYAHPRRQRRGRLRRAPPMEA